MSWVWVAEQSEWISSDRSPVAMSPDPDHVSSLSFGNAFDTRVSWTRTAVAHMVFADNVLSLSADHLVVFGWS
jgi:hypothetical protein